MKYFTLAQNFLEKRHDIRVEIAKHNLEFPVSTYDTYRYCS